MNSMIIKGGLLAVAVFAIAMLAGAGTNRENMPDGRSIFVAASCNTCHSIQSQGIRKTGTSDAPDLSGCGPRRNADWITKYLNKEVALNGKKHTKKWKGSAADLGTLAGWLAGLKRR